MFESSHYDENDIQTISHKCHVLDYKTFVAKMNQDTTRESYMNDNNDLYYLAGTYDPVIGTLTFHDGIF